MEQSFSSPNMSVSNEPTCSSESWSRLANRRSAYCFSSGGTTAWSRRRWRIGDLACQLIEHLRDGLCNAKALKEFHHRHVHLQVNRDAVFQLDGHQRVQTEFAQGLLEVQPGWTESEHPGHLLAQVGLQQLPAFRWFGRKKGIPPFARATRWPVDFGFLTRQFREQRRGTASRIKRRDTAAS